MRPLSFVLLFCFFTISKAQLTGEIFGLQLNSQYATFESLDLAGDSITPVASIGPKWIWQGHSTYDHVNDRYFFKNNSDIFIVHAPTGILNDSIPGMSGFSGLEYDSVCDCLVGIYYDGTSQMYFASLDPGSKTITTIHPVANWPATFGESTYDRFNRRYFRVGTTNNIEVLDHTGAHVDDIPTPPGMSGIEYDFYTDGLFGYYWAGSFAILGFIDVTTQQYQPYDTLYLTAGSLIGESTFDLPNEIYFLKTMNEIRAVDTQNKIQHSFPHVSQGGLVGIEYKAPPPPVNTTGITGDGIGLKTNVYPNPGRGIFFFPGQEAGTIIEICNVQGDCVYVSDLERNESRVNLEGEATGIYFYRLLRNGSETASGKLVIE